MAAARGAAAGAARRAHSRYQAGALRLLPVRRRRVPGLPVSLLAPRRLPPGRLLTVTGLLPIACLLAVPGLLAGGVRPVSVGTVSRRGKPRRTGRWLPAALLTAALLTAALLTAALLPVALLPAALLPVSPLA